MIVSLAASLFVDTNVDSICITEVLNEVSKFVKSAGGTEMLDCSFDRFEILEIFEFFEKRL